MPTKPLNERTVTGLRAPKGSHALTYWDKPGRKGVAGLFVLVQRTGVRSYYVSYRFPKSPKEHRLYLGRVGAITLPEARAKAWAIRQAAADGHDPKAAKAADPVNSDSFKALVERWTTNEQQGRKGNSSAERMQAYLLTTCKRWLERPMATISYSEIDDLLCELRDGSKRRKRKAPYSANLCYSELKDLFKWAVRTKRITVNPMDDMPKPWLGGERRSRPWFKGEAADDLVRKLWACADQLGGTQGQFIKLVLLLGKRRTAIETMRWEHISAGWYWSPTIGGKRKRCHPIPLPKLAQRILSPRGDTGRVLDGSVAPSTLMKQVRKLTGVGDFFWHGCRHVVETKLGELKVPPHVRDLVLDHSTKRGSGADYDHAEYRDDKLAALEAWCAHVERIVSPAVGVAVLR